MSARFPRSTLSVRTLGDTRMSAGTHTASVTEKFSTSAMVPHRDRELLAQRGRERQPHGRGDVLPGPGPHSGTRTT
jgi:hypothetical protein